MESQAAPQIPPPAAYPVRLDAERQPEYNRFLPLVKWLLAFPHYIVLALIGIGAFFAIVIAFFAVLITGRFPRGLFDFVAGTLRWGYRVFAYVYLLTDEYPPFSLGLEPDYPVRVEIDYPETVDALAPARRLAARDPLRIRRLDPGLRCGDRRLHRGVRDPVHPRAAGGNVQADPDPGPVATARPRLQPLDGNRLPAVRLGRVGYSPSTLSTSRFARRPSNSQ